MSGLARELRQALRGLLASPAASATVVLSLALGIGANAAVFSVASALLLRPLPYADPERLVILWNRSPGIGITEDWFSTAQYFDIRASHAGLRGARDRDRRQLQPHRATACRSASARSARPRTSCRCWARAPRTAAC